jgi:anti-sigma factor RsiW
MINFTIERQRHRRFVGCEDVLAQLDEWLVGPGEAGWVVVAGGPGMGKSAVLSAWLARREAASAMVPHHFVRRQARSAAVIATTTNAVPLRIPSHLRRGRR